MFGVGGVLGVGATVSGGTAALGSGDDAPASRWAHPVAVAVAVAMTSPIENVARTANERTIPLF